MAFETGTVASASALKTTIETFCTSNGWTEASGILNKDSSHIKLVVDTNTDALTIQGATSSDFLTGVNAKKSAIYIANWGSKSVTYWLFAFASPAFVLCMVQYDGNKHQFMAFGDITKYGSWTGGNWYGATYPVSSIGQSYGAILGCVLDYTFSQLDCMLFGSQSHGQSNSYIYTGLDSVGWSNQGNGYNYNGCAAHSQLNMSTYNRYLQLATYWWRKTPNAWNGQTVLAPVLVGMIRSSSLVSLLGDIPSLRSLRIDNYAPGDILTLGSDDWMLFPWMIKSTTYPLPREAGTSGCLGLAVKYDGP